MPKPVDTDQTKVLGKKGGEPSHSEDELPEDLEVMLVVVDGKVVGQEFPILKPKVVMGREGGTADIIIPDSGISRQHAEITLDKSNWYLRDLGSTNGTLKNGAKISRTTLKHGEKFKIGETTLQFLCEEKTRKQSGKVYEIDTIE